MKTANLLLAFFLEIALLAALAWGFAGAPLAAPWPVILAVLAPLSVAVVWGLFAAPRARFPLPTAGTVVLKTVLLASGAATLFAAGQAVLGILDGALVLLNVTLGLLWNQYSRDDPLKTSLASLLDGYARTYPEEAAVTARFREFLASGEPMQGKTNPNRHITGSTWIVNPARTRVLLTHHAKLGIWVQLGGHVDEGEDWTSAALREAREESGLTRLRLVTPQLFDLDVHAIPARPGTPAHDHYDLRFLVEADDTQPLTVSEESHDVAWVSLAELETYTTEPSQLRMKRKTR